MTSTPLLDRDWLLIKTDFLMHAARNPDVADRLLHHRSQLPPLAAGFISRSPPYSILREVIRPTGRALKPTQRTRVPTANGPRRVLRGPSSCGLLI
ncbi:MAG: hypothetical protein WA317_03850, partial [Mycobacterium sp.]